MFSHQLKHDRRCERLVMLPIRNLLLRRTGAWLFTSATPLVSTSAAALVPHLDERSERAVDRGQPVQEFTEPSVVGGGAGLGGGGVRTRITRESLVRVVSEVDVVRLARNTPAASHGNE